MHALDWDQLSNTYADEVCDIFMRDRRRVIARWLRASGSLRGRPTVLDIGCGIGSFFRKYGRRCGAKLGSDHSAGMLRHARRRCRAQPDIAWAQADIFALPAAWRASADLVVCANVLTFVAPRACDRALRQVVRTLRPGGHALLILPSLESHDAVWARRAGRPTPRRAGGSAVVQRDDRRQRFFTTAGAGQLATRAGLIRAEVQKVWYPWIDEGVQRPPRGAEPPWDWLVTGLRPAAA